MEQLPLSVLRHVIMTVAGSGLALLRQMPLSEQSFQISLYVFNHRYVRDKNNFSLCQPWQTAESPPPTQHELLLSHLLVLTGMDDLKPRTTTLHIWRGTFTVRVTKHWHRLPRGIEQSPSLDIFKTQWDTALSLLLLSLLWAGGWTRWSPRCPPASPILW